MLFISILYISYCCVFITNLYHLGSWGGKDIKRQVGGKGENFWNNKWGAWQNFSKSNEKLDKFVKSNHFRNGNQPKAYNKLRSIHSKITTEPCAPAVDRWHFSLVCSTPHPSSINSVGSTRAGQAVKTGGSVAVGDDWCGVEHMPKGTIINNSDHRKLYKANISASLRSQYWLG